jgi:transposase-like protein
MTKKELIKKLYSEDPVISDIARKIGVSRQYVHQIVTDYKNTGRQDRANKRLSNNPVAGTFLAVSFGKALRSRSSAGGSDEQKQLRGYRK